MSRIPIPDDWVEENDGWAQFTVCVPNSTQWRALFRGAVYNLTRGRKWDEDTGIIKDAQVIAWRIYDSMQNCTDNLKVTRMLVAAILGEQVDLTDPAQLTPDNVNYTAGGGLPGLVPTLLGLQLSPVTNVAAPTVNVDCGGGCGCEPGTEAPPTGGVEGDPPPTGWGEPTDPDTGEPVPPGSSAYQNRKCKAANLLHDGIREFINQMNIYGVEGIASALGLGVAATIILSIVSAAITGPAALVVGILGGVTAIVLAFVVENVNASTLVGLLDTYQEDLVCALYNSQSADQAIADYGQVLTDAGANSSQTTLIWAILTYATANALFFKKDGAEGDQVEQDIEDYVGEVDCSTCYDCDFYYFPLGTNIDDQTPNYVEITTEITDNAVCDFGFANSSRAIMAMVTAVPADPCDPLGTNQCFANRTVTAIRFIGGTFNPLGSENHAYINYSGGQIGHTGFPGTDWEGSITNIESIGVAGNASGTFTVRIEFS